MNPPLPQSKLEFLKNQQKALEKDQYNALNAQAYGDQDNYIASLQAFNPTSKDPEQEKNEGFGLGLSIGNFSFGYSQGNLPQWGERQDYNAFLIQAGSILKTNRFMATIFFPWADGKLSRASSYACEEVQMNSQTIEAQPYRLNMQPSIMAPTMRDYGGTVTLTFRMFINDSSAYRSTIPGLTLFGINLNSPLKNKQESGSYQIEPRKSLLHWQNQIVNFDGQFKGVNYFDNYAANASIIVSTLDTSSNVLHNIEFVEVYPLEVGGLNPSWDGQNAYMKQTVTFAFTRIADSVYGRGFIPPEVLQNNKNRAKDFAEDEMEKFKRMEESVVQTPTMIGSGEALGPGRVA